jgi:hypothetical protein
MQEVPPTEPVEEGDEGEWDTVGEPRGSKDAAMATGGEGVTTSPDVTLEVAIRSPE